jgi:hypothetical protein
VKISLVTHSVALTPLSCNMFPFCIFPCQTVSYTNTGTHARSEESDLKNNKAKEMGPIFLSNSYKIPCPEKHKHDGRSEVVH